MKNLKFTSMMLAALAAVCVTFTSCDDDDDSQRSLTPQEQQTAFNAVKGDYSGKLVYTITDSKTGKYRNDTIATSWSIQSDSVMTVRQFPVAALANNITDSVARKALLAEAPQDLTCAIGFIRVEPSTFLVNPVAPTFNITYGGKAHKVQIPFYINSYYSFGTVGNKQLRIQLVMANVYEDGNKTAWLKQAVPFVLIADKK